jgi:hypothetical protein
VKAFVNQRFLNQTEFDSASPAGSAVVAHEFERDGAYELALARKNQVVTQVPLRVARRPVRDATEGAAAADAEPRPAVSVDIAKLARPGVPVPALPTVPPEGWVSFTSSQPVPGHHIRLRRVGEGAGRPQDVFDSRKLGGRSVFALTLLRPGRYSLVNSIGGAQAEIVVAYPKVGSAPYRPPEALQITVADTGFGEGSFPLSPAQGIVFRFKTASRVQIALVEPDDGPPVDPRPRARFAQRREPEPRRGGRRS